MRPNTLKQMMNSGQCAISAWLSIPSTYSAEILARQGYDCVNVDLQHGMIDFSDAVAMLQAISTTNAIPIARVGSNDPVIIMKLLDAGAYGIICPMISSISDAQQFVKACRYPPVGDRSFGPARGLLYGGADYVDHANDEIMTIGMIETREALDNVEAIAKVEGLDALFIGPNDLSLALNAAPKAEPDDAVVVDAIQRILDAATNAGKPCGMFCSSAEAAVMRRKAGFRMVVPGNDASLLSKAAQGVFAVCSKSNEGESSGSGY